MRTSPSTAFLENGTLDRLEEAVAWNHHEWMTLQAQAAGGEVCEEEGVSWVFTLGSVSEGAILFPQLAGANADAQLDTIVRYYRERRPEKLVGCWSLDPPQPADLGIRLLARGFQLGWRPCWMALDLGEMRTHHARPRELRIERVGNPLDWEVDDLPYYSREKEAVFHTIARTHPRRIWHFAAWLGARPVAHSMLFLTTGALGVAGIYNVGVVPGERNRGIGKAVTLAACRHAERLGCRYALLNGTGERMYRQLGFERIGHGLTWWLNVPRLEANPPTPMQVALAESVGRGDIGALDSLLNRLDPRTLNTPLTNGMTPMELAVKMNRPISAEWLVRHGATLDILSAWDLGWRERVSQLLREKPELANRRGGEIATTPLHEAVERNDIELARLILAADPDLEIKDARFDSTPIGWANHLQRTEILDLLERHRANRPEADLRTPAER